MSLATVSMDNRPSCRIVLLKGIERDKFLFYTNYQSHKGKELEENPVCALTFFWPELERQVRIEGNVSRVDEQRSRRILSKSSVGIADRSLVIPAKYDHTKPGNTGGTRSADGKTICGANGATQTKTVGRLSG